MTMVAMPLAVKKIFISAGDHDLAENIVPIVLAHLPNAPAGTRGISLLLCQNLMWMRMIIQPIVITWYVVHSNIKWGFMITQLVF